MVSQLQNRCVFRDVVHLSFRRNHVRKGFRTVAAAPGKSDVVIVGGGPAGLAAVLMLTRRGWTDITLIERNKSVDYVDKNRAYVYNIDGRGRRFTNKYGLSSEVEEAAVSTLTADITVVPATGKASMRQITVKDDTQLTNWLPRSSFMQVFLRAIQQNSVAQRNVTIITDAKVVRVERNYSTNKLDVVVQHADGTQSTLPARLLLGCDGLSSVVRSALAEWHAVDDDNAASSTKLSHHHNFTMQEYPSLSTGIRFKVLHLTANPHTRDGTRLDNQGFAVLSGASIPEFHGANPLRLGLLPIKDATSPRTANLTCLPDHPVWSATGLQDMQRLLTASFPQVDFDAISTPQNIESFATCTPGAFPAPQYCDGMTYLMVPSTPQSTQSTPQSTPQSTQSTEGSSVNQQGQQPQSRQLGDASGVVLLGDALHCFPPDLGQGVNSALEDVVVFDEVLEETGDDLSAALPLLQQRRLPEAVALVRLMQIGFPLQYNQYPLRRSLFFARFLVHSAVSGVLPWVHPPAFAMVQDARLSYTEIWKRAQETPLRIATVAAAVVLAVACAALLVVKHGTPSVGA